jgi:hypothetical protein
LTNEALASLTSGTVQLVKATEDATLTGNLLFKAIEPAYEIFLPALDKSVYSKMGEQIATLNKPRDNANTGLHWIVKGWSKFENDSKGKKNA